MLVRRAAAFALFAGLFFVQTGQASMDGACDAVSERMAEDEHCDHPVSPEECRTMAPCGTVFIPAPPASGPQPTLIAESVAAARIAMPPSVSFPPERRPPRA